MASGRSPNCCWTIRIVTVPLLSPSPETVLSSVPGLFRELRIGHVSVELRRSLSIATIQEGRRGFASGRKSKEVAIFKVLKAYIKESKPIRFDGNGYSDEWKEEAAKRGLDCQNSVPLQYDAYLKPESIEMFTSTGVLTQKELEARNEVKWEVYIKRYRSRLGY